MHALYQANWLLTSVSTPHAEEYQWLYYKGQQHVRCATSGINFVILSLLLTSHQCYCRKFSRGLTLNAVLFRALLLVIPFDLIGSIFSQDSSDCHAMEKKGRGKFTLDIMIISNFVTIIIYRCFMYYSRTVGAIIKFLNLVSPDNLNWRVRGSYAFVTQEVTFYLINSFLRGLLSPFWPLITWVLAIRHMTTLCSGRKFLSGWFGDHA
jgi:hypothetical protein